MAVAYDDLLATLTRANGLERSPDQHQAEAQLKQWEIQPGYHYLLQLVYLDTGLPLQVRWLAIICFKNGIEKYWRSSRQHAIAKDEKAQIKRRLFDLIHEQNNQLTIQNAHSVARVVRFDFPGEWPGLFDDITRSLEECVFVKNDLVLTNNLLIVLNQIIKTVSMVRIGRARHAMQSKAPIVVPTLTKLYAKFFHQWSVSLDLLLMEVCYLCLKNLRRIIPEGFDQPHRNPDVVEFLKSSVLHLQMLVLEHEKYSLDLLERYVKSYGKLYVNLINANPTLFVLLPCLHDIMATFLQLLEQKAEAIYNSSEENDFWEVLALKGLLILKKMITYIYKKGAVTLKQRSDKEEVHAAIAKLTASFFTPLVVQHLCDLIITWYLRLKPSDLESWLLEPEEWCNEELLASWEYQIRPCAENFFQDLIRFFKDDLAQFILNKISQGIASQSVSDILIRDSIFCTFQLLADSITESVDFDRLLNEVFIPEGLKNDLVEYKILKRRICLIISEWVSVSCSQESRVSIYRLLISFLQPENKINDKVVKLTAIQTLRIVINDWDFKKHDFQPFLNEIIALSISMLTEMGFTELKLYILNTLGTMVERTNPLIDHQALISILAIIPGYWNSADSEESILKTSLLRVLKNLVVALNENSNETFSITVPLIESCCTEGSEFFSLLAEDGYELWLAVLQYYPGDPSNEILKLFALVQPALVSLTEVLPVLLSILRSYALLAPQVFSTEPALEMMRTLSGYLASMRDDAFAVFVPLLDILFLLQSSNEAFVQNVLSSGLFSSMVNYVLDDNQSIQSANKMLLVLSRLANKNSQVFLHILDHLQLDTLRFMDVWLQYYINNGNPRNKKINLLAFLALLAPGVSDQNRALVAKFADIAKNVFLFLEEVNESSEGNCVVYNQDYTYEDIDDYAYLDADIKPHGEKMRYKALLDREDPVYRVNLRVFLKEVLLQLRQRLLEADFAAIVGQADPYTREKMQEVAE